MRLLIGLSVQVLPSRPKTVYLGHEIAHRVKRTICHKRQKTLYLGHGTVHRVQRGICLEDIQR